MKFKFIIEKALHVWGFEILFVKDLRVKDFVYSYCVCFGLLCFHFVFGVVKK